MKMKIAAALLLTGSVQASEIDNLINTSNSLVAQIDRGRMLVGAAIENGPNGYISSPGLSASAQISNAQVDAYNNALASMANYAPYGDAQTFLETQAGNELDLMQDAVDSFTGAVVELTTVVQVNDMAKEAQTPDDKAAVQNFTVTNDLQVNQETVDTYNQSLTEIETHSNNAGAYLGVAANKESTEFLQQGAENNNSNFDTATLTYDSNQQWVKVSWMTGNATAVYVNGTNFDSLYVSENDILALGAQSEYYNSGYHQAGYDCMVNESNCEGLR